MDPAAATPPVTASTAPDGIPAVDWQGGALDCASCPHRQLLGAGRCQPAQACVADRYAKRIDRFFAWNPALADSYLAHPYFEVRAVAAKHATLFQLPGLLADPDETVRWSVAQRLPQRYLMQLRGDRDREVRIRVAARLAPSELKSMLDDPDYYVRTVVARRIPPGLLTRMLRDPDREVRVAVARRIDQDGLRAMAADSDAAVRLVVAQRLPPPELPLLLGDPDWRVRHEVALRIDAARLAPLLEDDDEAVREAARERSQDRVA